MEKVELECPAIHAAKSISPRTGSQGAELLPGVADAEAEFDETPFVVQRQSCRNNLRDISRKSHRSRVQHWLHETPQHRFAANGKAIALVEPNSMLIIAVDGLKCCRVRCPQWHEAVEGALAAERGKEAFGVCWIMDLLNTAGRDAYATINDGRRRAYVSRLWLTAENRPLRASLLRLPTHDQDRSLLIENDQDLFCGKA
ncbi:MAG TPA: hypothetical protein VL171_08145 [Verrucomicrobiae bacterium]|nr:hypothetical protein [Verrucomicrobiae bacterium]